MKKILFGLSLVASAAFAPAAYAFPTCVDFSAAGYCDAMQYNSETSATWIRWDCASNGDQTKAVYSLGKTVCKGAKGCNPAAAYGWDALNWKFKFGASTGKLTGISGGVKTVLQNNMPVSIYEGACTALAAPGGKSVLSR